MSFSIRQMSDADLEATATVIRQAYAAPPWNEVWSCAAATERASQLLDAQRRVALAACIAEDVVGIAIGTWRRHHSGQLLYIEEIAVLPQAQGAGIGKALLAATIDAAKAAGCQKIWLVSQRSGSISEFYSRNGFTASGQLNVYTKTV